MTDILPNECTKLIKIIDFEVFFNPAIKKLDTHDPINEEYFEKYIKTAVEFN